MFSRIIKRILLGDVPFGLCTNANRYYFSNIDKISNKEYRYEAINSLLTNSGFVRLKDFDKFYETNLDTDYFINNYASSDLSTPFYGYRRSLPISFQDTMSLLTKDVMNSLNIFSKPLRLLSPPYIVSASFTDKYKSDKISLPDRLHFDRPDQVRLHIALNDLCHDSPHMIAIPGSNKYPCLSKKILPEVACIGPKKSFFIHTGNTLHRLAPIKNGYRCTINFSFGTDPDAILKYKDLSVFFDGCNKYDIESSAEYFQILCSHLSSQYFK